MAIQCCFERYEKKYCLTLSQQRFLLERMTPYMKKDAYGEYTTPSATFIMIPTTTA